MLIVFSAGCAEEGRNQGETEMRFSVDPERLGNAVEAPQYGVRFRPPRHWQPLSAGMMQRVKQAAQASETPIEVEPLYAFADTTQGSFLSVSALHGFSDASFGARVAQYANALRANADSLQQATFRRDSMDVAQFLMQPAGRVNFKLVLNTPANGPLQFDYVVPKQHYSGEARTIESSIGSIQQLEKAARQNAAH